MCVPFFSLCDLRRENPEAVDQRHEFITANLKPQNKRISVLSMTNIALQMTVPAAPLID
jgi:hypothetical protein